MAKMTKSQMATAKRNEVLDMLTEYLTDLDEEVMRESGNTIVFPSVDADGNELYVKITVAIPRGDRSGEAYNGHDAAQAYEDKQTVIAAKREQRAKEHEIKVAEAKRKREAAKAKKEAEAAERAEILAKMEEEGE